jgi:hypothetical protein
VSRLLAGHVAHARHGDHAAIADHRGEAVTTDRASYAVTATSSESLTSMDTVPTLTHRMAVFPAITGSRRESLISLRFTSEHRIWLKRRALEKALREGGRESVSAVLAELVQREIDREGQEADSSSKEQSRPTDTPTLSRHRRRVVKDGR